MASCDAFLYACGRVPSPLWPDWPHSAALVAIDLLSCRFAWRLLCAASMLAAQPRALWPSRASALTRCFPGRSKKQLAYVNSLTNFISATRPAPVRGGILADDMGLGKNLTVLCEPQSSTLPCLLVASGCLWRFSISGKCCISQDDTCVAWLMSTPVHSNEGRGSTPAP